MHDRKRQDMQDNNQPLYHPDHHAACDHAYPVLFLAYLLNR